MPLLQTNGSFVDTSTREKTVVVLGDASANYPLAPFNPPQSYPELVNLPYSVENNASNKIYAMVRECFRRYGLDTSNYATANWNPLCQFVVEGNTVVIKPNLVKEIFSAATHASLLRPMIDYVLLALKGKGKIVICDAPLQSSDFDKTCDVIGLRSLLNFYKSRSGKVSIQLLDLRVSKLLMSEHYETKKNIVRLLGDPLEYSLVDLGKYSFHSPIDKYWQKYAVTCYDLSILRKNHTNMVHRYLISNTILHADVIISLPKLKCHKKAGITVALKNFIGINGSKEYLPHHRSGVPANGGDELFATYGGLQSIKSNVETLIVRFPALRQLFLTIMNNNVKANLPANPSIEEGNWYGNDTLWRTIIDLNVIVKYCKKDGTLTDSPQRTFLFLVDGILGQEGEAPIEGHEKKCNTLLLGSNPCAVDYVSSKIMGFNPKRIPQITAPFENRQEQKYPLVDFDIQDILVVSNVPHYQSIHKLQRQSSLRFTPSRGWKLLKETS